MPTQSFWSDASRRDPKRAYRFVLESQNVPAFTLKSCQKPRMSQSETEKRFLNHTFYYPGAVTWEPIELVLNDPVDPDMSAILVQAIRAAGYTPPTGSDQHGTSSKRRATAAVGELKIKQIDSDGNPVEIWTLQNAWIRDVNFGDLDYTSDDMTDVTVTLRFDWAWLETNNSEGRNQYWRPGSAS